MKQQQQESVAPEALQVIGQGTRADQPGYPFLLVTSQSEPGRVHVVTYLYEGAFVGSRAWCDCTAASYGKACKHVLVARAWLAGSLSGAKEATRLAQTERPKRPKHADVVEPLLRHPRGNRPFSLLKS